MMDSTPSHLSTDFWKTHSSLERRPSPDEPDRVLLVEDDEVTLTLMIRQIQRSDPEQRWIAARNFAQAEQALKYFSPTLLVSDFYLDGDKTGLDLLRMAEQMGVPFRDSLIISAGAPLPALFAAEREGLRIKFAKKPMDRFLLHRFLQFDLDPGYYL